MRHKRVARITINIGAVFPKRQFDPPEVLLMANINDSDAQGPLSATATDKYGEAVPATFTWETDGAIGAEGAPMISLVVLEEGNAQGLAAGTYVRAGDDIDGPASTVTGTSDALDPDGNPIKVAVAFVVVATAATGADVSLGEVISKTALDAPVVPPPAPGDGEQPPV